jgi:formylglycine-generating enzyme required for sulfatase activity
MIGNVWEWMTDWYSPKNSADGPKACCIPENPRGDREEESYDPCQPEIRIPRKIVKGGSHTSDAQSSNKMDAQSSNKMKGQTTGATASTHATREKCVAQAQAQYPDQGLGTASVMTQRTRLYRDCMNNAGLRL